MTTGITHRERVLRSIEYKQIDRIPFFFRAETSITERLKKKYNLKEDLDIISYFDADAIHIGVPYKKEWIKEPDEKGIFYDMFGNKIKSVEYETISSEKVVEPILAGATAVDDIYKINWPDRSIIDLDESVRQAKYAYSTDLAVYGGVWASIFTHSRSMMGEERYLVSMISNPQLVSKLVERITDCFIELNEAYLSACSKYIDIYYFGSDFGAQSSMFISRDMFCDFFKSNLKRLVDHAKGFGLKVMFHTCGAVSDIVPDLIECGVDILDPVQVSASNMAPDNLASKFKNKIAFHGGISTQTTLPYEKPEVVREKVISTIETLGPLGYIAAPDQDMLGDIPTENIEMMFETIKGYKL